MDSRDSTGEFLLSCTTYVNNGRYCAKILQAARNVLVYNSTATHRDYSITPVLALGRTYVDEKDGLDLDGLVVHAAFPIDGTKWFDPLGKKEKIKYKIILDQFYLVF